jgi:sporulation protein YlmC with PRC-barrel domain
VRRMERAYREDELLDSTVIDSEGYIYGKIGKVNIKEDEITLLVYEDRPDEKTVVDLQALKEELLRKIKPTFLAEKLQKLSPTDILIRDVRKELDLKPNEPVKDQHYIDYAERTGIEVKTKKATEERKEPKGQIPLQDVKAIGVSTVGTKNVAGAIRIVLLQGPKEAAFRKIPPQKTVSFRDTDAIKDKLVIDSKAHALGYLDSVVLFQNAPGIRIYAMKLSDSVSLSWLIKYLDSTGRSDIVEALMKYFKVGEGDHVYRMTKTELDGFMQKTRMTFKVPDELLIDRSVKDFVMDIPWSSIAKIGDIIILKKTLSEFRSEGF